MLEVEGTLRIIQPLEDRRNPIAPNTPPLLSPLVPDATATSVASKDLPLEALEGSTC